MTPFNILSARLQSETPVCGVAIEPYVLVRRADGTTVTAGMLTVDWLIFLCLFVCGETMPWS